MLSAAPSSHSAAPAAKPAFGKIRIGIAVALAFAAGAPALAIADEQLAREKGCFTCHDVTRDKIGPSFTNISRRFSGLNNAKPMLVRIVHTGTSTGPEGGPFHWGTAKMPPEGARVPVNDAEAEQLIDYILSLK